ncbi:chondroitin sulfate proteoglycan 5-like isoform X2 [Anguilla anguilla]|uniref:chondroitin sulfate proteoglycan 5-like isoform X2 n=1 Tax=Anguilla anguilla TaxID=7936 RepID=UPI0015AA81E3|nr:chondroitin sulfate proteoglycan 5-like isoform X2 [Anguilla anguilla]
MDVRETRFNTGCWRLVMLSSFLLLHWLPLCAHGETLGTNITVMDDKVNSSSLPSGESEQVAAAASSAVPFLLNLGAVRKPRGGEEAGSGMLGESEISSESAEKDLLLKIPSEGVGAGLPTGLPVPPNPTDAQLELKDEEHTDAPWQGTKGGLDVAMLDLDHLPRPSLPPARSPSHPDVLTVDYIDPASRRRDLAPPSPDPASRELQGGDSWTMSDFYYYDSKDDVFSTTEVYPDSDQYTTVDMADENVMLLTTTRASVPFDPRLPGSFGPDDVLPSGEDEGPPSAPGLMDGINGSDCRPDYVRSNGTCRSPCDLFPNYCFNGGQCYLAEGIGVFCRCNAQDYMWHKGSRCEAVITEFQVMCIAIGAAALMVLLLFMITVFFAKKLHLLKTENSRLHKRSKYRPPSEQHNDNFSLSTIAEGSHPNVRKLCDTPPSLPHARALAYYDNIICQKTMNRYTWECKTKEEPDSEDDPNSQNKLEDPVKAPPPKEDEPLNIQNSLTPKHENNHLASEENSSEVNSLQNNMM